MARTVSFRHLSFDISVFQYKRETFLLKKEINNQNKTRQHFLKKRKFACVSRLVLSIDARQWVPLEDRVRFNANS